jgi:hypothetical protein
MVISTLDIFGHSCQWQNKVRKKQAREKRQFIYRDAQHLQHIRWSTRAQGQVHPKIVCARRQVKIMQTATIKNARLT